MTYGGDGQVFKKEIHSRNLGSQPTRLSTVKQEQNNTKAHLLITKIHHPFGMSHSAPNRTMNMKLQNLSLRLTGR